MDTGQPEEGTHRFRRPGRHHRHDAVGSDQPLEDAGGFGAGRGQLGSRRDVRDRSVEVQEDAAPVPQRPESLDELVGIGADVKVSYEIAKRYGEGLPVKSAPNTMMTWMFLGKLSANCLMGTPGKYRLRSRVASGRESGR